MIRRPPRSTQSRSSAASDVYKRQFRWSCWAGSGSENIDQPLQVECRHQPSPLLTNFLQATMEELASSHDMLDRSEGTFTLHPPIVSGLRLVRSHPLTKLDAKFFRIVTTHQTELRLPFDAAIQQRTRCTVLGRCVITMSLDRFVIGQLLVVRRTKRQLLALWAEVTVALSVIHERRVAQLIFLGW